eukprot:TRINITY_DN7664_c0_g1_i1.p1 TRINITY_DN7664_c0_g1~~TRINITY_DN7664_c0_g1_i1.p1  ORF type:complete len:232 (+),score=41.41 TRINITY_DN7664_c0_g1_i1:3-698(+)
MWRGPSVRVWPSHTSSSSSRSAISYTRLPPTPRAHYTTTTTTTTATATPAASLTPTTETLVTPPTPYRRPWTHRLLGDPGFSWRKAALVGAVVYYSAQYAYSNSITLREHVDYWYYYGTVEATHRWETWRAKGSYLDEAHFKKQYEQELLERELAREREVDLLLSEYPDPTEATKGGWQKLKERCKHAVNHYTNSTLGPVFDLPPPVKDKPAVASQRYSSMLSSRHSMLLQ